MTACVVAAALVGTFSRVPSDHYGELNTIDLAPPCPIARTPALSMTVVHLVRDWPTNSGRGDQLRLGPATDSA